MKVYIGNDQMRNLPRSVICIGIFDGVHLGHQKIISRTVKRGRSLKIPSVAITFDPHPLKVLKPRLRPPMLYSLGQRLIHLEEMGLDYCWVLPFTKSLSRWTAEEFIQRVMIRRVHAKRICIGQDFRFGHKARGSIQTLKKWSPVYDFDLDVVKSVRVKKRIISSTRIRHLIVNGDIREASRLLGRAVSLFGQVVHGDRRARQLGFPTVNLKLTQETIPPPGVYAARILIRSRAYKSALHIGPRPTFGDKSTSVEAHILNFRNSLYMNKLEVFVIRKIRNIHRFTSPAQLRHQIKHDVQTIERLI